MDSDEESDDTEESDVDVDVQIEEGTRKKKTTMTKKGPVMKRRSGTRGMMVKVKISSKKPTSNLLPNWEKDSLVRDLTMKDSGR